MRPARAIVLAIALSVLLAGCGGGDGAGDGNAADADVTVMGADSLAFEPTEVTAAAGATLALTCGDAVNHTFVIEDDEQQVAACDPGATDTGTLDVEPGEYTFYCDVPGHREAGMEGTLTVE